MFIVADSFVVVCAWAGFVEGAPALVKNSVALVPLEPHKEDWGRWEEDWGRAVQGFLGKSP